MDNNTILDYIHMDKSIRVGLVMNGRLFKNIHVVKLEALRMLANDPLKRNDAVNACLINLNIILYQCFFIRHI